MAQPTTETLNRIMTTGGRRSYRAELWIKDANENKLVARPLIADWNIMVSRGSARTMTGTIYGFDNLLVDTTTIGFLGTYGDADKNGKYGDGPYGEYIREILDTNLRLGAGILKMWRIYKDGVNSVEIPIATLHLTATSYKVSPDGQAVTFYADDSRKILADASWGGYYKTFNNANIWDTVRNICTTVSNNITVSSTAAVGITQTAGPLKFGISGEDISPWDAIVHLCTIAGYTPFVTATGVLTAIKTPDPTDPADPVFTFTIGDGGTIKSTTLGYNIDDVYNAVEVTGETIKSGLIWAYVVNDDMSDPLSVYRLGHARALKINAAGVQVQTTAQTIANRELRRNRGISENIEIESIEISFLEEYDTVRLIDEDLNYNEDIQLTGYTITDSQDPSTTYACYRRFRA